MFDQTPVRLKLWQDGQQLVTVQEVESAAQHKRAARQLKRKPARRDQLQAELLRQAQEHPDRAQEFRELVAQGGANPPTTTTTTTPTTTTTTTSSTTTSTAERGVG